MKKIDKEIFEALKEENKELKETILKLSGVFASMRIGIEVLNQVEKTCKGVKKKKNEKNKM